jgi:hypothetical protein
MRESAPPRDFTGVRIGKLTAVSYVGSRKTSNGNSGARWLVRCDCGKTAILFGRDFRRKDPDRAMCGQCWKRQLEKS